MRNDKSASSKEEVRNGRRCPVGNAAVCITITFVAFLSSPLLLPMISRIHEQFARLMPDCASSTDAPLADGNEKPMAREESQSAFAYRSNNSLQMNSDGVRLQQPRRQIRRRLKASGENQPPAPLPVQLKRAAPSNTPRIFDLVLFSAADRDLIPLRIEELQGKIDVMILAESEFRFSDGMPKASAFDPAWLTMAKSLGMDVRHFKITTAGLEVCSNDALKPGGTTRVRDDRMRRKPGLLNAKCRESFGRNGLVQAFNELGGTDDDIALISDADEMPRAAALQLVRTLTVGRTATSLGAIHHFKYTLRCERGWRPLNPGATWLKGPMATTGRYLRASGAQTIRTPDGCVAVGVVPKCVANLHRAAIANASWHMSSLSGGVEGVVRKMKDNAANVLYDQNESLFFTSTVRDRADKCLHGENTNSRGARNYARTLWGRSLAPRYPDVPGALERALKRHELQHFLSWESGHAPAEMLWDSPKLAPVQQISPQRGHYRNTWGPCNRLGCDGK